MARRSRGAVWPLLGLVLGASLHPAGARAAEALPGGALDITISGFARFLAGYGDIGGIGSILNRSGDQVLNNYDFFNDTEVHIVARGVHDATGIEYGGTIEFNADTNRTDNTDETWVFVRGAPGELRFGDTNSAATTMRVGGDTVAVGTGGIDGELVDLPAAVNVDFLFFEPSQNLVSGGDGQTRANVADVSAGEDVTKIVYFSPIIAGLQLGVSYAPDSFSTGDALAVVGDGFGETGVLDPPATRYDDVITAGLAYSGLLGELSVKSSVVGIVDPHAADRRWGAYAGSAISFRNFAAGAGIGTKRQQYGFFFDDPEFPVRENDKANIDFFNVGVAYQLGSWAFSVTYGIAKIHNEIKTSTTLDGEDFPFSPSNERITLQDVVLGVEVGLLPGLVLSTELAYFNFKGDGFFSDEDDDRASLTLPNDFDEDGIVGVTRLAIAF